MSKESGVPALIFVPDMSGFTEFIIASDIELSREVIPTLLTGIIESNTLEMKVSDIQGDAVMFYKTDNLPRLGEVIAQCKKTYLDFAAKIKVMEKVYAQVKEYKASHSLGLKFIIHYGEVAVADVEGITKLIGEDVIIPFRLLKNSVPLTEYILFTEESLNQNQEIVLENIIDWAPVQSGKDEYEHLGQINYKYVSLEPLAKMTTTV